MKFWDIRTKLRRNLTFTNRTSFVIKHLEENSEKSISQILEEMIEESDIYKKTLQELESYHDDIRKENPKKVKDAK